MHMNKNTVTKLISALAVLVIAVILMIINFTVLAPEKHLGEKQISLLFEYADTTYEYTGLKTNATTVGEVLREYDKALDLKMKTDGSGFITSFKGTDQDKNAGAYYTYTRNDAFAASVDREPIEDGDVIKFSYGIAEYGPAPDYQQTAYRLAPSAGLRDKSVSAAYVAVWVVCGVAVAASIALIVWVLLSQRKKPEKKDGAQE